MALVEKKDRRCPYLGSIFWEGESDLAPIFLGKIVSRGWGVGDQCFDDRGDVFLQTGCKLATSFNNACVGRYGNDKL